MENMTRIGVSLEPELLEKFDKLIEGKGYTTRSEAIRDLIREELVKDIVKDNDANIFGTITLIYEHHKGRVKEQLMDIQHAHHSSISSSIHVHLNLEQCLEVLIVSGTVTGPEAFVHRSKHPGRAAHGTGHDLRLAGRARPPARSGSARPLNAANSPKKCLPTGSRKTCWQPSSSYEIR